MEALLARRARSARSSVIRDLLRLTERPGVLSLAGGLPAPATFPVDRIAASAAASFGRVGATGPVALQYGPTEGDAELRELVASRHGAGSAQVLITAGSQQGLDLLARVLIDPGDVVVVEEPGYVGAIQALRASEPQLVGIEVDADGMRTDLLEAELVAGLRPKLVYTVPNFQNPTGAVLSPDRRAHLGALADRYGFVLVEDDPYGELYFDTPPPPSLRSFGANVVTLGSSSKILAPGLRVGWLVAPEALIGPTVRLKQAADLHTSSLSQRIVAELLGDAAFLAAHLPAARSVYRVQAAALSEALPLGCVAAPCRGGLFLWVTTDPAADTDRLLEIAVDHGVAFVPGSAFRLDGSTHATMRLSYATLDPAGLATAGSRLAAALDHMAAIARQSSLGGVRSSR